MSSHLSDEGLAELAKHASFMTPAAFNAHLDEITGVNASREVDDEDGVAANVLQFMPTVFREHLKSQDIGKLSQVMQAGDVMNRVAACLRLLRLPESQIPPDAPPAIMVAAQRLLSQLLVQYPVLMHNRIFMRGHHFANAEFGPIATIIGKTPRAEFPRTNHGLPLDKLRAFSRHHCVLAGLTKAAPCPSGNKSAEMQGKTLLASFGAHAGMPRPRMLTAVLELDDHRASAYPTSRRPASFLTTRGATETSLRTSIVTSLLAAFNIAPLAVDTSFDATDFKAVLKTSGITKEAWFLRGLEANLYRWAKLPAEDVGAAFTGLAAALKELRPYGLGPADVEVQPRELMRWLVSATLDSSATRAVTIGVTFKAFPSVDAERAVAMLAAVDEIGHQAGEDAKLLPHLVESAFGGLGGEPAEVWRAALRMHRMRQVIAADTRHQPVADHAAAPERRSRAV